MSGDYMHQLRDTLNAIEDDGFADLAARLDAMAEELIDPLICRTPAYGVPGHAHCAACCYGLGYTVTSPDEQTIADAAAAMKRAAVVLRAAMHGASCEAP